MPTPLSRCIHHSGNISAAGRWCFRSLRAPRVARRWEVNFHSQELCHHRVLCELFARPGVMLCRTCFSSCLLIAVFTPSAVIPRHSRAKAGSGFPARSASSLPLRRDDVASLPVAQQFPRFCDCRAPRSCSLAKSPRAGASLHRHFLSG